MLKSKEEVGREAWGGGEVRGEKDLMKNVIRLEKFINKKDCTYKHTHIYMFLLVTISDMLLL